MKNSVKIKDFCGIEIPSEKDNILEFNQYMRSDKMPYIMSYIKKQAYFISWRRLHENVL